MSSGVMRLPPLPTIRDLIRLYKLGARKNLSQNFLLDLNITRKIVRAAGKKIRGSYVCEVGPGPGGITRSILEAGVEQVVVVEKDKRFIPGLQMLNEASGNRVKIVHDDILNFDMSNLFPEELAVDWGGPPPGIHIIGNLPFNVSTPLIIRWLHQMSERAGAWRYGRTKLTLTFQKEVAERMVAPVCTDARCRLSVMCQYLCHVKHHFTVPGRAFQPPPDVDVGVVTFIPRKVPVIQLPFKLVEKVVRHTFHFRRKMSKRGIETLFPPDRPDLVRRMIVEADVPPDSRPFMLVVEEVDRLCQVYKQLCDEIPGLIDYNYRDKENAAQWRTNKLPLDI